MEARACVLIVDDEAGPREALNMVLKPFYGIYNASSGPQAIEIIQKTPIDLAILDLRMPGMQGTDLLREIKKERGQTEVIILTGYGTMKTAVEAIRQGAADYLLKPFNIAEMISAINRVLSKKRQRDRLMNFLNELGNMVGYECSVEDIPELLANRPDFINQFKGMMNSVVSSDSTVSSTGCLEFVRVLSDTLENKDPFTYGHSSRVNYYANLLAEKNKLGEEDLRDIQIGAHLHDIGKLGIETDIIYKQGSFTKEELLLMRRHPEIGVDLVSPIGLPKGVISIIRNHHEFFNGTGYPDGLRGEMIPLPTRIVSISECFDAMITDRPYRKALSLKKIVTELKTFSGKQFDPSLVKHLLALIEEKREAICPKTFNQKRSLPFDPKTRDYLNN